jgi:hypothetical protein
MTNNNNNTAEYEKRSYEDLSLEFQRLYPSAVRAFELIPLMYNRLTLVDKLSHREAYNKIYDDHRCLSGFSTRNISRYLPSDNPSVPRRVRTSCPKNSYVEANEPAKLSTAQYEDRPPVNTDCASWTSNYGRGRDSTSATNYQLQEGLNKKEIIKHAAESELNKCEAALLLEKQEIEQALVRQRSLVNDDDNSTNEIEFTIPKEKYEHVKAAMDNSRDAIFLIFDKSGILERAESDVLKETKK